VTYVGGPVSPPQHAGWSGSAFSRTLIRPKPDFLAALLLLLGGTAGLLQYLLGGYAIGQLQPVGGAVLSGRDLLHTLAGYADDGSGAGNVTRIAILVATVGGGALVLLGISMLLPLNHRPLAAVSLIIALAAVAAAVWLIAQAERMLGSPVSAVLDAGHPGWYYVVAVAVFGLFGSVRALGR
jgi:hypothetical protein